MIAMLNEFYAGCTTPEEFEEARQRLNLWICCDLDPEVAMEYIRRQEEAKL